MKRLYFSGMLAMLVTAIVSTTALAQTTVYLPIVARDGSANSVGYPIAEETPQPTPTIGQPIAEETPQPTPQPTQTPQPTATAQPIEVTPQPQNFDPLSYMPQPYNVYSVCNGVSCSAGVYDVIILDYALIDSSHVWQIKIMYRGHGDNRNWLIVEHSEHS